MSKYQATLPLFAAYEEIDSENGIIKGVSLAREGEAKGHGVMLDSKFIRQVVAGGKEHKQGMKARFGHPNMCSDALGTYLGRFKNFRRDGEQALADLHLDDSAKDAPSGNLHDYVLSMAASNPDMFGASVVFIPSETETKKTKNDAGEEIFTDFARIHKLLATDLVDSPASGENLFSGEDLSSQVTVFLDRNPKILELISDDPSIVDEFMERYNHYKTKKTQMSEVKENTEEQSTQSLLAKFTDSIAKLTEKLNAKPEGVKILDDEDVSSKLSELETKLGEATDRQDEIDAQAKENTELSEKVTELEGKLAAAEGSETELNNETETEIGDKKKLNDGQKSVLKAIAS